MKIKSILFAALVAGGVAGVAPVASAMPAAPQKAPGLDAQQAHSVWVCEHGRCFWREGYGGWRGDRWGYGGGWRRDRWYRDRDWDHDWDRDRW